MTQLPAASMVRSVSPSFSLSLFFSLSVSLFLCLSLSDTSILGPKGDTVGWSFSMTI